MAPTGLRSGPSWGDSQVVLGKVREISVVYILIIKNVYFGILDFVEIVDRSRVYPPFYLLSKEPVYLTGFDPSLLSTL
jgi:hypothetical protein